MVETVIFKLIIDVFSFLFLDDIDNFINLNTAIDLHKNFGHFTKVQRRHYAGKIYYLLFSISRQAYSSYVSAFQKHGLINLLIWLIGVKSN